MKYYQNYISALKATLDSLEASNQYGETDSASWLSSSQKITEECKQSSGRFIFIGNGASAAFASHMSLDWSKNGGVPCVPMFDLSHLTALGNDLGYDEVFATQIGWHGTPADVLITVSSSGNSPNLVRAIEVARERGMKVVTLSGLKPDNKSRAMGDLNLYIPAKTYGIVECAHQILLHAWLDHSMGVCEWDRDSTQNMNAASLQL